MLWGLGLVLGLANMAGGYLGARTAVKQGSRFIRIVFLVVVGALILKLGSDVWQDSLRLGRPHGTPGGTPRALPAATPQA